MVHQHAIVGQGDVTADRHVHEGLGTHELDRVEEVHQNFVYGSRSFAHFFVNSRRQVELAEGSQLETLGVSEVTIGLCQVGNTDQAKSTHFEDSVASVLADKDIDTEGSDPTLNLDVDPN